MIPKVSVIVPNYNHERFLRQRIDSILNQTFTDFELILLDDCSTDNSYDILLSYQQNLKVTAIKRNEKNTGSPFKQWENGIKIAQGKYIWIAESDDYADSKFLEHTVKAMEEHPEASICLTGSYLTDVDGNSLPNLYESWQDDSQIKVFASNDYLCKNMFWSNWIYNASMVLFRKEGCLDIANEYREMRYCGDWFFWIEQIRKGSVIEIHQKLNYFRQHDYNTTKEGTQDGKNVLDMIIIKSHCYKNLPLSWGDKMISRGALYHMIKHLDIPREDRNKLFQQAAKLGNITHWTHFLGTYARIYIKHICGKKNLGKRLL